MPIVAAAKAIASRQAIIFPFDVCIGLAGPPLSCRVWTSADAGYHSTKLRRRWFVAPTVVLRENRRSRSLMTVRRLTAQCLPPLRNKRNSTGDCHAGNFKPVDVADRSDSDISAWLPDVRFASRSGH